MDRYDGKEIRHYKLLDESKSLTSSIYLGWLYKGDEGRLWVISKNIHNDIANLHLWKIRLEKERAEPFRRQIQKLHVAVSGIVQREVHFTPVHPGINRERLHPAVPQILHLVFHQRDKGSDDQRDTVRHQSRHLEAHGFSASGREYRQHVLAVQRRPHDLLLHGPERGVSPVF